MSYLTEYPLQEIDPFLMPPSVRQDLTVRSSLLLTVQAARNSLRDVITVLLVPS